MSQRENPIVYPSSKNRAGYFDPVGYTFSVNCYAPEDEPYIRELALAFARELLPLCGDDPWLFNMRTRAMWENRKFSAYWDAGELRRRNVEPDPDHLLPLVNQPYRPQDGPDRGITMEQLLEYGCQILPRHFFANHISSERCPDRAAVRAMGRLERGNAAEGDGEPRTCFLKNLSPLYLYEDPEMRGLRIPRRMINPGMFLNMMDMAVIATEELERRLGDTPTDEERRRFAILKQKGYARHSLTVCVPRCLLPEGRLSRETQDVWLDRMLCTVGGQREFVQGFMKMDSIVRQGSILYIAPGLQYRVAGGLSDSLPEPTWGNLLTPAQVAALGADMPEFARKLPGGGAWIQLTDDINRFPVEPLLELYRRFAPYAMKPFYSVWLGSGQGNVFESFRLPLEFYHLERLWPNQADITGWGMNGK